MCCATRYAEAILLCSIKAPLIVKELVKFCTTFGLPRVIQTDQGSNFTSKVFAQALAELGVTHKMSSAYHPEAQGALERFHQTLKYMLRAFCVETDKDWVDGLPLLMFAIRESVHGPLKLLSEQLLKKSSSPVSVLEYVSSFREHLHQACMFAKAHLADMQYKMKKRFDQKSVSRNFQAGGGTSGEFSCFE